MGGCSPNHLNSQGAKHHELSRLAPYQVEPPRLYEMNMIIGLRVNIFSIKNFIFPMFDNLDLCFTKDYLFFLILIVNQSISNF